MTEHNEATKIINAVYCQRAYAYPCTSCASYIFNCKGRHQKTTEEKQK